MSEAVQSLLNLQLSDPLVLAVLVVVATAVVIAVRWRRNRKDGTTSYQFIRPGAATGSGASGRGGIPAGGSSSGAAADDEDSDKPLIMFLVASQTGTAEEYARRLAKDAKRLGFRARTVEMNDVDKDQLPNFKFVVLVASTYGEGDPPDNSAEFHRWLLDDSREPDLLGRVQYTVFSLGNKTYQSYQAMGRTLDRRFEALGALRVFERGEGDDDGSLEDDFLSWQARMWPAVCTHFGLAYAASSSDETGVPERRCRLVLHEPGSASPVGPHLAAPGTVPDAKAPLAARVLCNRELHAGGDRSCRHVEFDLSESGATYRTGDHLGVYPENDPALVSELCARLDVEGGTVFSLLQPAGSSAQPKLPAPCCVRDAFGLFLDVASPPRKAILRLLAEYASDAAERTELLSLSDNSPAGRALYEQHIHGKDNKPYLSLLGVLQRYPSVKPDLGHLLEALPALSVRYYSISSSSLMHPTSVHITAVVTGVCTNYLRRLGTDSSLRDARVRIFVRPSSFRLPAAASTPLIMIGPGTGLAPFRGFMQERAVLRQRGAQLGPAVLFYGCRRPDHDYLYREELQAAVVDGVLTDLHVAFSREPGKDRVYVQHLLAQRGPELWQLLQEQRAHLYICGDAKAMAKDVETTLAEVVRREGRLDDSAAAEFLRQLAMTHRKHQDVW